MAYYQSHHPIQSHPIYTGSRAHGWLVLKNDYVLSLFQNHPHSIVLPSSCTGLSTSRSAPTVIFRTLHLQEFLSNLMIQVPELAGNTTAI